MDDTQLMEDGGMKEERAAALHLRPISQARVPPPAAAKRHSNASPGWGGVHLDFAATLPVIRVSAG